MTNDPDATSQPTETGAGESPATNDPIKQVAGAMMVAANAVREGAVDARQKASQLAPGIRRAFSKTVYTTCYYSSYGVVFPVLLLVNVLPLENAVGHGLADGARAARDAVADQKARRQANREASRMAAAAAKAAEHAGGAAFAPA